MNPPGFVWGPVEGVSEYRVEISRSRRFDDSGVQTFTVTGRTLFVLPEPLQPGRWYWRWWAEGKRSEVFSFEMLPDAAEVRIGTADELAARMGDHPRLMVRPGALDEVRRKWKNEKSDLLSRVTARADEHLTGPHEIEEPPFLPLRSEDYVKSHIPWRKAMVDSRKFTAAAKDMALAYLLSGERRYAEAVGQRLDSLARWNPDGSTTIQHNDEPHMSVINWGPFAFDWTADALDDDVRERFAAHLARRADNTLEHLLHWPYEVNPISNHAGRMIGFLGHCGLALAGHHERAGVWLRYILELMVSMYPVWGREHGGWAQGHSYCGAYVKWILEFLFSLRTALGIDLYRKPFFRNHGRWWALCLPEWAWQTSFGDGADRKAPLANAAVITSHLGMMTGDESLLNYGRRCAERAGRDTPFHGDIRADGLIALEPLLCLAEDAASTEKRTGRLPRSECFDDVGHVAFRRDLSHPEDDVALIFKSSPYGPISHSHGDQNCFTLSAYGKPLLIRTGYYTGYGSPHHQNWIRQTKAHNNVTAGGVGQWVNNYDAVGRIAAFKRGRDYAYACGDASAAYGKRVSRFHRHVLFVDRRYFLIVDDLASPIAQTFEWHLHSMEQMMMDEKQKEVRIAHEGALLEVDFLSPVDMRFYRTDEFDVPHRDPERGVEAKQWHLRVETVPVRDRARIGMLLIPNRQSAPEDFDVQRLTGEGFVRARVEHMNIIDEFLIATGDDPLHYNGRKTDAIALWARDGEIKFKIPRPKER